MPRCFLLFTALALALVCAPAQAQTAADNAEARVFFERGNVLFGRARSARGAQRTQLLGEALAEYASSLQITRSRNALYNAAIVSADLGRNADSYNYFSEYAAIDGLSDAEIADARTRMATLRDKVGVVTIASDPTGAMVNVDRADLASMGKTPIDVALVPGAHLVIVRQKGYKTAARNLTIAQGELAELQFELTALPVPVTVLVEPGIEILIDGKAVTPNERILLEPGAHTAIVRRGSTSSTRSITIMPGEDHKTLRLSLPTSAPIAQKKSLRNGAIAAGATSLAVAGVAVGLAFRARNLRDDYNVAAARFQMSGLDSDKARAESLADDVDRANLTADAMFGVAGAAGVTGLVLYLLHRKKARRDKQSVSVAPSRHGVMLQAQWPLGAAQ